MPTSTDPCSEYGLVPVATKTLRESAPPDVDVFLKQTSQDRPTLFHKRGEALDLLAVDRLLENGVDTLYVSSSDIEAYSTYLLDELMGNEDRPPAERFSILRDASQSVVLEAMATGGVDEVVNVTNDFAQRLVNVIWDRQVVLMDLFDVMTHDYGTFTHASNVSAYCLILAEQLGIHSPEELISIGQGGLLHDIGKRHISKSILNKKTSLTEDEWTVMQQHPADGFEELSTQDDVDWGQLMMVYQHHERWDGKGYPVGLSGEEIHPWAMICAVVDVFDALTTDRPYRKRIVIDNAVNYLELQAGLSFDPEIVRCWTDILKQSN